MNVPQARRRSPDSVAIQQSWQAPIRQKPARGSLLNSLERSWLASVSTAVAIVSPASAVCGLPSSVKATGGRAVSARRFKRGIRRYGYVIQRWPTRILSRPYMRSSTSIATAVNATISADTAAISGSIDSVAYMYMRTGNVTVDGAVTKMDIVTSSKLLIKASSQPPVTPGRIIGRVTRRNTVAWLAPSDNAACSALRSDPSTAATTNRNAYGVITTTWASASQKKLPVAPISEKVRSIATPSTRCGMIRGDRNKPFRKSRPGNWWREIASPAGTAMAVASVAARNASARLFLKDCTKSEWANTALNQRSDTCVVGILSVFSGVKATTHTITSGASMKAITSALNTRASGPFLLMMIRPSPERLLVRPLPHAVVAEHH